MRHMCVTCASHITHPNRSGGHFAKFVISKRWRHRTVVSRQRPSDEIVCEHNWKKKKGGRREVRKIAKKEWANAIREWRQTHLDFESNFVAAVNQQKEGRISKIEEIPFEKKEREREIQFIPHFLTHHKNMQRLLPNWGQTAKFDCQIHRIPQWLKEKELRKREKKKDFILIWKANHSFRRGQWMREFHQEFRSEMSLSFHHYLRFEQSVGWVRDSKRHKSKREYMNVNEEKMTLTCCSIFMVLVSLCPSTLIFVTIGPWYSTKDWL